jgi:hypothetical protein
MTSLVYVTVFHFLICFAMQTHPTVGHKTIPPRAVVEEEDVESIDSSSSSSSDSESESDMEYRLSHRKRALNNTKVTEPSPARAERVSNDSKLVAPLPVVRFLQARQTHKACGRCEECKKPPCGVCKQCVQNQKHPKPNGNRDRRRCEALKCKKDMREPAAPAITGVPMEKEEISKALQKVSTQLANISALRGTAAFNEAQYDSLVLQLRNLHEALASLKNSKSKQTTSFPQCFHDAFGVVAELEKKRLKFAKFVVRAGSGADCRTLADRREMRDDLEKMITFWCTQRAKNLAPVDESSEYDKVLHAPKRC